jgi:segregation and condensation protein A
MQNKIFDIVMNEEEITWQTIIFDLVRSEKMDPWDVNVSLLAKMFLDRLKTFKETDFRISGKVLLAAAIMLRIKSTRLLDEDMGELDRLIASSEQTEDEFYEELQQDFAGARVEGEDFAIVPRTPQPRKRKVSVYDLVEALNKALEVQGRRPPRETSISPEVKAPENVKEITAIIGEVYQQIKAFYTGKTGTTLTFSQLIPSESKEDKVYTFIPLLHLNHQRKIDLEQQEHFGEIEITLLRMTGAGLGELPKE